MVAGRAVSDAAPLGGRPSPGTEQLATLGRLPFVRAQSCGNDFLIIDDRNDELGPIAEPLARLVCRRGASEGADGILLIGTARDPRCAVRMRLVNPDGSDGEMCGNGALAFALVASDRLGVGRSFAIETMGGVVDARVTDASVGIVLGQVSVDIQDLDIDVLDGSQTVHRLDIYSLPHAVVVMPQDPTLSGEQLDALGGAICRHPVFERGTNVDFIFVPGTGGIAIRTFERGVDRATLSCGTGAIAATIVGQRLGLGRSVAVRSAGGTLDVNLEHERGGRMTLDGRPRIIADGHLLPGAWTQ